MNHVDFKYEKKIIGHLIHHYRKQQDLSIKEYLHLHNSHYENHCLDCKKCSNPQKACSEITLRKIEKGFVTNKECIYYKLSENLKRIYLLKWEQIILLRGLRKDLTENIVEYSHTNLNKLSNKLEVLLEENKKVIYIEEILRLYKDITDYKIKRVLPDTKRIELYKMMKDIVDREDKLLILLFMFELGYRIMDISREDIIEECKEYLEEPIMFKIRHHMIMMENELDYYDKIREQNLDHLTHSQKFLIYDNYTSAYLNLGAYNRAYESIKLCIEILESGADLGDNTKMVTFKRAGIILYHMKEYEKSVDYFLKAISMNVYGLGINMILFADALEKIQETERIKQPLKKIKVESISNHLERKVIIYYRLKYLDKLDTDKMRYLEDYICEQLCPLFNENKRIYLDILLDDLKYFSKKTNNYKMIHTFLSKK